MKTSNHMFIKADFSSPVGPMRPVHGVNNGPRTDDFLMDATDLFREIGIPYSRLHDTEGSYGCGEFVDIPAVFKCFDADPSDPESYNFTLTDHYIRAILDAGTKVIYRLGVSIENGPYKKYIYPPKDYRQWARICEGIIRHYTEGWADGFTGGVEYFEIWNEPEFRNHMWMGTDEEFFRLFKDTVIYLKKRFPNVKIGGPATGYTREEFTTGFFEYMSSGERAPIDFFSFHTYFRKIDDIAVRMRKTRELFEKYGFEGAEVFCTEWNHVSNWTHMEEQYRHISDCTGAAFCACALCEFQRSGYDKVTYYDAQFRSGFNGLFKLALNEGHDAVQKLSPKPSFYAFRMFGDLYRLGTEVLLERGEGVYACAATDGRTDALLLGRYDGSEDDTLVRLEIGGTHASSAEIRRYYAESDTVVSETVSADVCEM
ncbi:MAG: hypothetical protein ILO42_08210, partial [Clostridia bacterium]|nr:hypothetical protein [Clostridia bacterium]